MMEAKWWNVAVVKNGFTKTVKLYQMMCGLQRINGNVKTVELIISDAYAIN